MTEDAFLRAIRAEPNDDTPRLIFADWLEEQGDPRAEFIRSQLWLNLHANPITPAGRQWLRERFGERVTF